MSASQVQSFLNKRVARCTIGDAGRKAGSKTANGNTIASKCLKDFKMTTKTMSSDRNCAAYTGKSNETAAQIIQKVGQACGISQRVLLVMLEKEQSLVTDTWPTTRMYNYAMGWACPDSGPGNSANCDPSAANFFTQVYKSAWQLKVYLNNPNSFNYKAGVNNKIQWHPNASCGTSTFKIKNNATAALYIYTPYRPNSAALRAGWGTGDSCSSYGNRNFYNFWKSWFGTTQTPVITGDIQKYYNANNGPSRYGVPLKTREYISANGTGYVQYFERGMIATSMSSLKTYGITAGPFLTKYRSLNGPAGAYGWLAGNAVCGMTDGGCSLKMQKGELWYSKSSGANFIPTALVAPWKSTGAQTGSLGYPTADGKTPDSKTAYLEAQKGALMKSSAGTIRLNAAQAKSWKAAGGYSAMGVVTGGAEVVTSNSQILPVQRGNLYVNGSKTPVFIGNGPFADAYNEQDGPRGAWGWPTVKATCGLKDGGCTLSFENGVATYSKTTGVAFLTKSSFDYWKKQGADKSTLGYPVGDTVTTGSNTWQNFQHAGLATTGSKQIKIGSGPFLDMYTKKGGPSGEWGWPTVAAVCGMNDGGCVLQFENGVATYSKATGVKFVTSDIYAHWKKQGADKSNLGYPTADTQVNDDSILQKFQKAVVTVKDNKYTRIANGPFLDEYLKQDGPNGDWGAPTATATCGMLDGGCTLPFENGAAVYSKTTGVKFISLDSFKHWLDEKADESNLGYPTEVTQSYDEGWIQRFQKGLVTSHGEEIVRVGNGLFLDEYVKLNGPDGEWGWPISPAVCGLPDSGCTLEFTNGTANYTKTKGVTFTKD